MLPLAAPRSPLEDVLEFWFGDDRETQWTPSAWNPFWFAEPPDGDSRIRQRFGMDVERASRGEYNGWAATPRGRLALILLLDQFTRNLYRESARAFAQDAHARQLVIEGIARGHDEELGPVERAFFYMPLMHSEDRQTQRLSVERFETLANEAPLELKAMMMEGFVEYARRHRDVVERFGRFPHRNSALGRASTRDELEFLKSPAAFF